MRTIPLTVDEQRSISPVDLAKLIVDLLLRNDDMPASERRWKVSYYPYQLSALRAFEIIGHSNPEVPEFARKWNEAITILRARALITPDPAQDNRDDFVVPTVVAKSTDVGAVLGPMGLG